MMNKKILKEKLENKKAALEKQLGTFATRDPKLKGDWDTRFPDFDGGMEEAADEVEEYTSRLPVEFSLEIMIKNINLALEKLKQGKYGKCENCGKKIDGKRLEVHLAARTCMKCQKQSK